MNNIKIFENDLPSDIDLSKEKVIGIDNEALGLVLGRDPLTLVQLGLESKQFYLIKLNRETYNAPNLINILSSCLLYTSPSPRDLSTSRMPSSA